MKHKKLRNIWLISIFIILVLFSVYLINLNKEESYSEVLKEEKYSIVKNYSDFYTVNSCIYRYLTYLQNSNINSLLKVVDDEFIKQNNINNNNIFNYLNKYDGNLNFSSKKMYEEKINENVYNYFVYGLIEKEIMDSIPEKIEAYFIVKLDKKNKLWTIKPYDGEIFR